MSFDQNRLHEMKYKFHCDDNGDDEDILEKRLVMEITLPPCLPEIYRTSIQQMGDIEDDSSLTSSWCLLESMWTLWNNMEFLYNYRKKHRNLSDCTAEATSTNICFKVFQKTFQPFVTTRFKSCLDLTNREISTQMLHLFELISYCNRQDGILNTNMFSKVKFIDIASVLILMKDETSQKISSICTVLREMYESVNNFKQSSCMTYISYGGLFQSTYTFEKIERKHILIGISIQHGSVYPRIQYLVRNCTCCYDLLQAHISVLRLAKLLKLNHLLIVYIPTEHLEMLFCNTYVKVPTPSNFKESFYLF